MVSYSHHSSRTYFYEYTHYVHLDYSALKKSKRTAIDQLLSDDDDSDAEMFDDIDEMEEENETKVSILCPGHK